MTAVQEPLASVEMYASRCPPVLVYWPTATHDDADAQETEKRYPFGPVTELSAGSAPSCEVQAPLARVSTTGSEKPPESVYSPTATHVVVVGQETARHGASKPHDWDPNQKP